MLLSKSAYARHMGVSRQTVYGWIARGEIVLSGDKVDVEATQAKQNSAGAGAGAGAGACDDAGVASVPMPVPMAVYRALDARRLMPLGRLLSDRPVGYDGRHSPTRRSTI